MRLSVFFDGTGNNRLNTDQRTGYTRAGEETLKASEKHTTNWLLNKEKPSPKLALDSDLASMAKGLTGLYAKMDAALDKIQDWFAEYLKDNEIERNDYFIEEIVTDVFGFSRGAATARAFITYLQTGRRTLVSVLTVRSGKGKEYFLPGVHSDIGGGYRGPKVEVEEMTVARLTNLPSLGVADDLTTLGHTLIKEGWFKTTTDIHRPLDYRNHQLQLVSRKPMGILKGWQWPVTLRIKNNKNRIYLTNYTLKRTDNTEGMEKVKTIKAQMRYMSQWGKPATP